VQDKNRQVRVMSEQPTGVTGEQCKSMGTYASETGDKQYFEQGECFGHCPTTKQKTKWVRVT